MMHLALPFISLLVMAVGQPGELPVMPYDSTMEDRVSIDGYVDHEDEEYPASFADKASGMTVNWGFDDSMVYVALESKGKGWMAVGFGSPNMNESNMIIGYYCDDSAGVINQLGAGHGHSDIVLPDSFYLDAEIDRDDETGITTLEFSYPLTWPANQGLAISGFAPGDVFDMILAQNTKSISFTSPHTNKSALKFRMAPAPAKPAEPEK
jgi:hypothetical protein